MKRWMRYLIIGWSIACAGIFVVSFQLMKADFVEESLFVTVVLKTPEKVGPGLTLLAPSLFDEAEQADVLDAMISISKEDFIRKVKDAKGIQIDSISKVRDRAIYIAYPVYAFLVWGVPILVFSLLGLVFGRNKEGRT